MKYPNQNMLVDSNWLKSNLNDPKVIVIDCPWEAAAHGRAHIEGARPRPGHPYVKTGKQDDDPGLHAPDAEEFQEMMEGLGIKNDSTVICYDAWGSLFAARMWWVMKLFGHEDVRVLNGGWQAWVDEGNPVSFRESKFERSKYHAKDLQADRVIAYTEILESDIPLVDARSDDEFHGKSSSGNRRVGHPPKAVHLEWNLILENSKEKDEVRRFRTAEEIEEILNGTGISKDKTWSPYCQAAVRGAFMAFTLELMGYPKARLYDGSMAEWANREETPLTL